MKYNDLLYLVFFLPLVLIAYQLSPKKGKPYVLLCASIVFYVLFSKTLIVYLILISASTYIVGRLIEQIPDSRKHLKSVIVVAGILVPLGFLIGFKYSNFFKENINSVMQIMGSEPHFLVNKFAQPIGLSFFSLQAVSYLMDVKLKKIKAEHNPFKILLFLSFFPTIIEGPIARYDEVVPTLSEGTPISYHNLAFGYQRILWGLFKKVVIADRIFPFVDVIFKNIDANDGTLLLFAGLFYTLQLYAEFSGTMDIVIGTGEIFGLKLPENFKQPFASKNVSEFWRRWHITLGSFFKDYIFFPISLSKSMRNLGKKLKPSLGKYYSRLVPTLFALFAVWLANGLWHGAQWQFILYGMYYFVLITLGMVFEPVFVWFFSKTKVKRNGVWMSRFQWVRTFLLVNVGMIIFRSAGVGKAWDMLTGIVTRFRVETLFDGTMLSRGVDIYDFIIVLFGFVVLVVVGILKERDFNLRVKIASWKAPLRISFYYASILFIIIFGAYGVGYSIVELIYANF